MEYHFWTGMQFARCVRLAADRLLGGCVNGGLQSWLYRRIMFCVFRKGMDNTVAYYLMVVEFSRFRNRRYTVCSKNFWLGRQGRKRWYSAVTREMSKDLYMGQKHDGLFSESRHGKTKVLCEWWPKDTLYDNLYIVWPRKAPDGTVCQSNEYKWNQT